jgi:hypothetical protein
MEDHETLLVCPHYGWIQPDSGSVLTDSGLLKHQGERRE